MIDTNGPKPDCPCCVLQQFRKELGELGQRAGELLLNDLPGGLCLGGLVDDTGALALVAALQIVGHCAEDAGYLIDAQRQQWQEHGNQTGE